MKGIGLIPQGQWPVKIFITNDRSAYRRFQEKHCTEQSPFPDPGGGRCQKLESDTGDAMMLIAIGKHRTVIELASCVAHEATHAMRWLLEHVGEKAPGTETEAYLVDHIVLHGMASILGKKIRP